MMKLSRSLLCLVFSKKQCCFFGVFFLLWTGYLLIDQRAMLTWTAEEPTSEFDEIVANLLLPDFDEGVRSVDLNSTWLSHTMTVTSSSPVAQEATFMTFREKIYQQRNDRVIDVCQHLATSTSPITGSSTNQTTIPNKTKDGQEKRTLQMSHFSVSSTFQTMGCFLNKVASSSLVSAFLSANGRTDGPWSSPHSLSSYLNPRSWEEFQFANKTYFKFMFVRHPMERILSCYLDKMVFSSHKSLPAFRRLVKQRGIQLLRQRNSSNNQIANATVNNESPTFQEFLEYILSTDLQGNGYDSHWVPFFRYCNPCKIHYDVIGKLETGADDFRYVWAKTGLISSVSIPWVNRATPPPSKPEIQTQHTNHWYYASLPRELIVRFFHAFRLDFELFDYSIDDILLMGGHTPLQDTEL